MNNSIAPPVNEELRSILHALTIHSAGTFSFAGRQFDSTSFGGHLAMTGYNPQGNPLVAALQMCLYAHCYCQPFRGTLADAPVAVNPPRDICDELSHANHGKARWDSGWQILKIETSGQVTAQKAGKVRTLWPGEFLTYDGPGVPPRAGSQVSVYFPKESKTMQPGFYFAFGEADADFSDDPRLARFYWNIPEAGAAPLTRWITQVLNRYQVPFRYKCLTMAGQFARSDAAVLYVNKKFFRFAAELIAGGYEKLQQFLRPETPLFARQLAPGLGLAEDPGNGESFGMNRCRILAEGIWNAFAKGLLTEEQKIQEVAQCFVAYGLDMERAYLNARSGDFYDTPDFAG
jgi:HopA1 effector protein family